MAGACSALAGQLSTLLARQALHRALARGRLAIAITELGENVHSVTCMAAQVA